MKSRVALIHPRVVRGSVSPIEYIPLGLAYLASVARNSGHEVLVIDSEAEQISANEVMQRLGKFRPDVVGISLTSALYEGACELSFEIRKNFPGAVQIFGGVHPTVMPDTCFTHPEKGRVPVDVIVRGEGEFALLEILDRIECKEPYAGIAGISYLQQGSVVHNPDRMPIGNLDSLPLPAKDLFPIEKYNMTERCEPVGTIMTGRGCPFQCTYCTSKKTLGKTYRFRSTASVIKEIEHLIKTYNVKRIGFYDDTFVINKPRVRELCNEIISRGIKVEWTCLARVNLVDEDMLRLMRQAGCVMVEFGIESGSQRMLDTMKKGITVEESAKALDMCRNAGLRVKGDFMIGTLGEDEESISETRKFLRENMRKMWVYSVTIFVPYPGAPSREDYISKGLLLNEDWRTYELSSSPVVKTEALSPLQLKNAQIGLIRMQFFDPVIIARRAFDIMKLNRSKIKIYKRYFRYLGLISGGRKRLISKDTAS